MCNTTRVLLLACCLIVPFPLSVGGIGGVIVDATLGEAPTSWPERAPAMGTTTFRSDGPESRDEVRSLRELPLAAQFAISSAVGREAAVYHAMPADGVAGFSVTNPAQGFEAELTASGFMVSAGQARWGLSLEGWGCPEGVQRVAPAVPAASANRVELRRGALVEWYENGPLGLQHGYTVEAPPAGCGAGEPIRLVLAPVGELGVEVNHDRRGLSILGEDGRAVLRYRGLVAFDAGGQELPAALQLRGDRVVVEVAAGGLYPVVVDPFVEVAKLTASDGAFDDRLGFSVAVSGDTVVVGADGAAVGGNDSQGAAYVFVEPVGGWLSGTEAAKLAASGGAAFDHLGFSVAVSGDTVVAGAFDENASSGAAYVFVKPTGGWVSATETGKLIASDAAPDDQLGFFVAISGGTIVVGARRDDDNGTDSGSAYVFVEPASGWGSLALETAKLTASDGAADDEFGGSVAVSGDTAVMGAYFDDVGANVDQGSAYVFVEPVGGWVSGTETAKLTASDGAADDRAGRSVAVSGDIVVVGAFTDDIGVNVDQGSAYVFVKPVGGWVSGTEAAKLAASDGAADDLFGNSTAVFGTTIVVGAPLDDDSGSASGSAYVFVEPVGGWVSGTETAKITAADDAAGDQFGFAVAASGNVLLVGAFRDDDNGTDSGSAYVFLQTGADLSITKDDGQAAAVPGSSVVYSVTASNFGPEDALGAAVADTFPAALFCTWTCTPSASATCTAGPVTGDINDTVDLPAGSSVTYTAVCSIDPGATGTLSNTAAVTEPAGVTDPDPSNNSATDVDILTPVSNLATTKTDGQTTAVPGGSVTYAITASNLGPSEALGATVVDVFPAALFCTWICTPLASATCTAGPVTGDINDTVALPAGSSVTYTAVCSIDPGATGTFSNTATVTEPPGVTDPDPSNNSATDIDSLAPASDLATTKTDGQTTANPGQTITYTIEITQAGPSDAPGSTVTDTFPAALTGVTWACAASAGSTCTSAGAGSVDDLADILAGGTVTYTATGTIDPAFLGVLSNTADAQPALGVVDTNPANNSATDTTTVASPADVTGTKEVAGTFLVGGMVSYTVTLTNSAATAQFDDPLSDELTDVLPPGLTLDGASATSGLVGLDFGANRVTWNGGIPGGGMVTIIIEATINSRAEPTVSNQGEIFYDADGDGSNDTLRLTDDPAVPGTADPTLFDVLSILEVPTVSTPALGLFLVLLGATGVWLMRRRVLD